MANGRRRTPGLRREELAQLAGLSVDWYIRLEQGRDVQPSRETLEAIATALRLDQSERAHLYYLARAEAIPRARVRAAEVDLPLARALGRFDGPAIILDRRYDVLAWNEAAPRLLIDFASVPQTERNLVWLTFTHAPARARYVNLAAIEEEVVAAFRAACAAHAGEPDFETLASALLQRSERFRSLWARHDVREKATGVKLYHTPFGPLQIEWHALLSPMGTGQRLVVFMAPPGSPDEERLASLIGG